MSRVVNGVLLAAIALTAGCRSLRVRKDIEFTGTIGIVRATANSRHGTEYVLAVSEGEVVSLKYIRCNCLKEIAPHAVYTFPKGDVDPYVAMRMLALGVLRLPDQSSLPDDRVVVGCGGGSLVTIEIRSGRVAREVEYDSPEYHRRQEDQIVSVIYSLVADSISMYSEEDLQEFREKAGGK